MSKKLENPETQEKKPNIRKNEKTGKFGNVTKESENVKKLENPEMQEKMPKIRKNWKILEAKRSIRKYKKAGKS